MFLPRSLISHLYNQLLRNYHPLSPPVLILAALEPDALCACRILAALLKRDLIPHKIHPVSGYGDLVRAGEELVRPMRIADGGSGGIVVCMGVGGLVDLAEILGLEGTEDDPDGMGGIDVWVLDARRPWNLSNLFSGPPNAHALEDTDGNARRRDIGVEKGCIKRTYKPGRGGIIVFDDGDVEQDLLEEREAYCALEEMPEVDEDEHDDDESDASDAEEVIQHTNKRKSWSEHELDESEDDEPPRQKRRSNSSSSIPSSSPTRDNRIFNSSRSQSPDSVSSPLQDSAVIKPPSAKTLRKRLLQMRRKHEGVLRRYYSSGTSYSEPISSLMYSLAETLGREDNDLLWLAIVGVSSLELSGRSMSGVGISAASESGGSAGWGGQRGEIIRQGFRDEVRRLNPLDDNEHSKEANRGEAYGVIPTTGRSPTDTSIRLSPEPRFLLIRHWSLYESMLHSPYLASRLHIWKDAGLKRLHKFLAKMGFSLTQCKQTYTHMDMELKKLLRQQLLKYAPLYGLDGLVPPVTSYTSERQGWGFVRSWGWKACLSATDVGVIIGAILEVGSLDAHAKHSSLSSSSNSDTKAEGDANGENQEVNRSTSAVPRFWTAYDALAPATTSTSSNSNAGPTNLLSHLPLAIHLHRAILRTGTSLLQKNGIRHLKSFRIGVVKDGPDVSLFTNPGALIKLALWVGEAVRVQEREKQSLNGGRKGKQATPLVLAGLDEKRGVYVVVGTGGGGGVVDVIGEKKRKEAKKKKNEEKEKKKEERREAKRAEKAAKRAENGEDADEEDEEEIESESDGSSSDDDSSDDDDDEIGAAARSRAIGRNRFGLAFQEVVDETNARVRIDSFEHCVVEVRKEDLGGFLEGLSFKSVVG